MHALATLTVANIRSFVRDRTALFWTLAFPVIFILLFGAIFSGGGSTTYRVGWVDEDGTSAAGQLRQVFAQVPLLELKDGSLAGSRDAMQQGDLRGIIVVPAGYGDAIATAQSGSSPAAGPSVSLEVYTDPSQQASSTTIGQIVSQVASSLNVAMTGRAPVLGVTTHAIQTQDLTAAAFLVPGILGMALMQLGIFGAVPLVAQREKLILKRLGATPLPRWTLVGSNVVLRLLIGIVQAALIVTSGSQPSASRSWGSCGSWPHRHPRRTVVHLDRLRVARSCAPRRRQRGRPGDPVPDDVPVGRVLPAEIMPGILRPVAAFLPLTYLGSHSA